MVHIVFMWVRRGDGMKSEYNCGGDGEMRGEEEKSGVRVHSSVVEEVCLRNKYSEKYICGSIHVLSITSVFSAKLLLYRMTS